MQQHAPKVAAALDKAGIPFAFSSEGLQNPSEFVRGVSRAIHEGGLTEDQALRALTLNAAKMAGASDRMGRLPKARWQTSSWWRAICSPSSAHIRRVFVDGWPVNIDVPAAAPAGGRRGGADNAAGVALNRNR